MGYFSIPPIVSIILLIIPFTAWILGLATRLSEKRFVAAILRFIFGGWLLWIIEIVLTLMGGCKDVQMLDVIKC